MVRQARPPGLQIRLVLKEYTNVGELSDPFKTNTKSLQKLPGSLLSIVHEVSLIRFFTIMH